MYQSFCAYTETDTVKESELREFYRNGITAERIVQAASLTQMRQKSAVVTLPSEIELLRYIEVPQNLEFAEAAQWLETSTLAHALGSIGRFDHSPVLLQASGGFSILVELCGSDMIFRSMKRGQDLANAICSVNKWTARRIKEAASHGIKLISLADPSAMAEVIGREATAAFSLLPSMALLKQAETYLGRTVLHLCPRLSYPLAERGLLTVKTVPCWGKTTLEALLLFADREETAITGHLCIHAGETEQITVLEQGCTNE